QLEAGGVVVGGDAQVADAAEAVGGGVRNARVLLHRQDTGVPRFAAQAHRVVDRQAEVVADLRAGHALDLVLVHDRRPDARQIDLRGSWRRGCERPPGGGGARIWQLFLPALERGERMTEDARAGAAGITRNGAAAMTPTPRRWHAPRE